MTPRYSLALRHFAFFALKKRRRVNYKNLTLLLKIKIGNFPRVGLTSKLFKI